MDARGFYEMLIKKFPMGELGKGLEPTFPGKSYQPMTYGLLLSSEIIYYRLFRDQNTLDRIQELVNWLIENKDLDKDGIPGWGLPHEWDAYQNGSVNPPNHPYTITTSIVMNGLLDVLSMLELVSFKERAIIQGILAKTALHWCQNVWTSNAKGGYFWYSLSKTDSNFTVNVSAMFLGTLSRLLAEHGCIFTEQKYSFVKGRINSAANSVISNVKLSKGMPEWYYTIYEDPAKKSKLNDVIHHGYILWGMELYRKYGGLHPVPWTIEQAVKSIDRFIVNDKVYRFTELNKGPARLWGAGMALAFYSSYDEQEKVKHLIGIIDEQYGPFPDLLYYPSVSSKNKNFYPRFAAHVLWGLSLSLG
ncbi:hypothetical protein DYI25_17730 [Mesobacillus boroniphilus]|uniref:Uncharacterized protein n=1 Tax=Mesobacillus boroniphilus TaxID=308892 RepID=A0A944CNL6_9BACI|nr:hypothetical protein [Mesobacillus boroniphilus]MBS8266265.1 hypothetical protein [Mesobacillus boroniphilus]